MPVIVNNPPAENNNGMGFFLGVIILVIFAILFFVYGLPYLRGIFGGTQVTIPSHINVNVQQGK